MTLETTLELHQNDVKITLKTTSTLHQRRQHCRQQQLQRCLKRRYLDDAIFRRPSSLPFEHGVDAGAHRHRHWLLAAKIKYFFIKKQGSLTEGEDSVPLTSLFRSAPFYIGNTT
jgi:hypothetical protein